jgi:hypothetical protein
MNKIAILISGHIRNFEEIIKNLNYFNKVIYNRNDDNNTYNINNKIVNRYDKKDINLNNLFRY